MIIVTDRLLPLKRDTVITVGNFDGVHTGHKLLIEEVCVRAKSIGALSVVWTFDEHPDKYKNGSIRLLCDKSDKLNALDALGVDGVYIADFAELCNVSPRSFALDILCRQFNAKTVVCGYDFRFGAGAEGNTELMKRFLEGTGTECIVVPPLEKGGSIVSSTEIRKRLSDGDIETVTEMLGRNYSFKLPVIHGLENGRKLGAPTINQRFPQNRVVPCHGVYAVYCYIDGKKYNGIANIGIRPTVAEEKTGALCETHVFDFNDDVYGKNVRIELVKMIRREITFSAFSQLKKQISEDIDEVKAFFADNKDKS